MYPELGLHDSGFRAPLFPSMLAAPYRVFGAHVGVARLADLVLGVVLVLLVERFASKIGGATAGLIAAIAVAVYPPLVANDVAILGESVSLILIVVVGMLVLEDRWLAAGVATGFLVLARNSAQLYAFVVAALLLRRIGWKRSLAFLGIAFLVVTPWLVRNAVQLGAPVLTTSNGFNLAALYSQEAHDDGDFVDPVFDERFEELRLVQFDELDWDAELQVARLRGPPGAPPRTAARRPAQPDAPLRAEAVGERRPRGARRAEPHDPARDAAAVLRRHGGRHRRALVVPPERGIGFLALTAAYFSLTSIFSVFAPRLRGPFDLVCCIGVGLLVARLLRAYRSGASRVVHSCTSGSPNSMTLGTEPTFR